MLSDFLHRQDLYPLIENALRQYESVLLRHEGFSILDPGRRLEPSSIAHALF